MVEEFVPILKHLVEKYHPNVQCVMSLLRPQEHSKEAFLTLKIRFPRHSSLFITKVAESSEYSNYFPIINFRKHSFVCFYINWY